MILLLGLTSMTYPVDATESENNSDKQSHLECMQNVPSYGSLTFVERKLALQQCAGKKPVLFKIEPENFSQGANNILKFCDNAYPTYLITGEIQFYALFKNAMTLTCVNAYNSPVWNYTGPDRTTVIIDYVHNQRLQQLDETKDQREKGQIEARLRQGQVMFVVDLFEKQDELIISLEKQLEEKTELISKNELLIQEQVDTIENLKNKVKNIVLTSTKLATSFVNEELLECLQKEDTENLSVIEKMRILQECTKIDDHKPLVISDDLVTKVTQNIISYCEKSYPLYLELDEYTYFKAVQHPFAEECAWIYQQPKWSYDGPDRLQVLLEAGKPHVEEYLNERIAERQKSVYDANLSKGTLMVLKHIYNYGERQVDILQSQIEEKDEIIGKQDTVILQKMKEIAELSRQIQNSVFKPYSSNLNT